MSKTISIKFVALDCKETAVLNSKLKIMKGSTKTIIVFIDKLKVYKNCFTAKGMRESRRIIDNMISNKTNGILLNMKALIGFLSITKNKDKMITLSAFTGCRGPLETMFLCSPLTL